MKDLEKIFMLRVKEVDYISTQNLSNLLTFLKEFKNFINSVAFFVGNTHNYTTLQEIKEKIIPVKFALSEIKKELKISAGINVLSTIGHLKEEREKTISLPKFVDYTGKIAESIPCPSSFEFLKETEEKYKLLAQTLPDFIWIDDDLRPHNHRPLKGIGCFCEKCIEGFNTLFGEKIKRQDIEKFILEDSIESREFFEKWDEWCNKVLFEIAKTVKKAVHSVNVNIKLGLMLCGGFYPNFDKIIDKLRKNNEWVFIRPGGGFYTDEYPKSFIFKSIEYSRQISIVKPKKNDKVLAEIENFPYNYQKSSKIIYLEILASIVCKCNGATLNITGMVPKSIQEYRFIFDYISNKRKFLENIIKEIWDIPLYGVYYSNYTNYSRFRNLIDVFPSSPYNLIFAGIPMTGDEKGKIIRIESFSSIHGKNKKEIEKIFSENIIADASVLFELEKQSLLELAGVKIKKKIEGFAIEKFLPIEINSPYENTYRDSRPGFFEFPSYTLELLNNNVIPLNELKKNFYTEEKLGYSATIFKNKKNGNVVIFGYDPWLYIFTFPKINQLHNLVLYLSSGFFPFLVISPLRVCPFVRCNKEKIFVFLFNCNFDIVNNIEFFSSFNIEKIEYFKENGKWENIIFSELGYKVFSKSRYRRYKIHKKIMGWDFLILRIYKK